MSTHATIIPPIAVQPYPKRGQRKKEARLTIVETSHLCTAPLPSGRGTAGGSIFVLLPEEGTGGPSLASPFAMNGIMKQQKLHHT